MKSFVTWMLAGILFYACSSPEKSSTETPTDVVPVSTIELKAEQLKPVIHTSGVFTTDDETLLAFKTGGVIEKILVKEGDPIRTGQLLATLNLTEIDARVAQAQLAFEKATRDFNRAQNLYKDSVATPSNFKMRKQVWMLPANNLKVRVLTEPILKYER